MCIKVIIIRIWCKNDRIRLFSLLSVQSTIVSQKHAISALHFIIIRFVSVIAVVLFEMKTNTSIRQYNDNEWILLHSVYTVQTTHDTIQCIRNKLVATPSLFTAVVIHAKQNANPKPCQAENSLLMNFAFSHFLSFCTNISLSLPSHPHLLPRAAPHPFIAHPKSSVIFTRMTHSHTTWT